MEFLRNFSKSDKFDLIFVIVASQKLFVIMIWTTYLNYNEFGKDFRKSFLRGLKMFLSDYAKLCWFDSFLCKIVSKMSF